MRIHIIISFVIHFLGCAETNAVSVCKQFNNTRIRVTSSYRINLRSKSNQAGTKISSLYWTRLDPLILFVDIRLVHAWLFARTEPAMRERDLVSRLVTATLSGGKWEWARNKRGNVHIVMHLSEEICLRRPWKLETR